MKDIIEMVIYMKMGPHSYQGVIAGFLIVSLIILLLANL